MTPSQLIAGCCVAASISAVSILALRGIAEKLGLVDNPDDRKHHVGRIPLVGGLAFTLGTIVVALTLGKNHLFVDYLLASCGLIAFIGVLDDRYGLRVSMRFLGQALAVLAIILGTGIRVNTLGDLWGHSLALGWMSIPFTVFAVIGLINAMNMMDGIDGLAGGLTLIGTLTILVLMQPFALHGPLYLLLFLCAAILPYLFFNFGMLGCKVFMGDAGSMVIGYLLAWGLIWLSNAPTAQHALNPADVLWCIALPVFDTLTVMVRRTRNGTSPFKPDRGHIHHLLMARGLSPRLTLLILLAGASGLALIGVLLNTLGNSYSLTGFAVTWFVYYGTVNVLATASRKSDHTEEWPHRSGQRVR